LVITKINKKKKKKFSLLTTVAFLINTGDCLFKFLFYVFCFFPSQNKTINNQHKYS
jgi:hypothetical protein